MRFKISKISDFSEFLEIWIILEKFLVLQPSCRLYSSNINSNSFCCLKNLDLHDLSENVWRISQSIKYYDCSSILKYSSFYRSTFQMTSAVRLLLGNYYYTQTIIQNNIIHKLYMHILIFYLDNSMFITEFSSNRFNLISYLLCLVLLA